MDSEQGRGREWRQTRARLSELRELIARWTPCDGFHQTAIHSLYLIRYSCTSTPVSRILSPSLGICCTVIMFTAAFEPAVTQPLVRSEHPGRVAVQRERSKSAHKLTILPAFAFLINGNMVWATASLPKKLTSKTRRTASRSALLGRRSPPSTMPALFTRTLRSYPLRCGRNCFFFQEVEWNRIDIDCLASEYCGG